MGPAVRSTPSEIEGTESFGDGALDEGPIQEHVGCNALVFPERRGPRHLEFARPAKSASAGDRPSLIVRAAEPHVVRERFGERLEKNTWLSWRAEIAHVPGKDLEKG